MLFEILWLTSPPNSTSRLFLSYLLMTLLLYFLSIFYYLRCTLQDFPSVSSQASLPFLSCHRQQQPKKILVYNQYNRTNDIIRKIFTFTLHNWWIVQLYIQGRIQCLHYLILVIHLFGEEPFKIFISVYVGVQYSWNRKSVSKKTAILKITILLSIIPEAAEASKVHISTNCFRGELLGVSIY